MYSYPSPPPLPPPQCYKMKTEEGRWRGGYVLRAGLYRDVLHDQYKQTAHYQQLGLVGRAHQPTVISALNELERLNMACHWKEL